MSDYNPRRKTAEILDRAFDLVVSVPYRVSARWLFYRLLQEGFYGKKEDYTNKLIPVVSAARHAFYKDWRPDTLADETRAAVVRGEGDRDVSAYLDELTSLGVVCRLDKWYAQPYYVELWYEARAMTDQFKHYTDHITLVPMGGQPSIPYKWDAAKRLEVCGDRYDVPVVVLYFGDLDRAGGTIADVVERDVRKWCLCNFEFVFCGLTLGQVRRYGVPENPDKPGEYQWEALSDGGAAQIIADSVKPYLHHDAFSDLEAKEDEVADFVKDYLGGIKEAWNKRDLDGGLNA